MQGAVQAHETEQGGRRDEAALETNPSWRRAFQDLTDEHGFEPLRVEGHIPQDLNGTLYRNGPALLAPFGEPYGHWFDGDGGVSGVRFGGGSARGAIRVVQGQGLLDERRHGRRLYSNYGTPTSSRLREILLNRRKNSANTSVLWWQNRLFALWEGGRPTELDPETLETLGETDLEGVVPMTFSAHPHAVPARGATYNFGVRYGRKTLLDLFELPRGAPARRIGSVPLGGATMIHDFIATENHLVFFAPPLRLRALRVILRLGSISENLDWRPDQGTEVLVVPIDDPARAIRFSTDPFYQWHFANAYERDGRVEVDFVRYPDFETNAWLGDLLDENRPSRPNVVGTLHRAVIDLGNRTVRQEQLSSRPCEFPQVSPRQQGRPHRFVYAAAHSSEAAASEGLQDRVAKFDLDTGAEALVDLGADRYPSEPLFVPRQDSTGEDDGYLLTLVYDGKEHRSHVAILDARDMDVLGRVWFDHHLPFTFHGVWAG